MTIRNRRSVLIALAALPVFACKPTGRPPARTAAAAPVLPPRLAGMPAPVDSANIYAGAGANDLDSTTRRALPRVYVPLGGEASVTEIDPATFKVLGTFPTATLPQHVVPGYDFSRLWVTNDIGNSVTPIDPVTGKLGKNVPVSDPYNLYFTPDGKYAIVVAERAQRLDFRDPHTMAFHDSVRVDCKGVDHMDFTADGRFAVATCEFSGKLVELDVATHHVLRYALVDSGKASMPQDIRLAPDGHAFFIADMLADGVFVVDADNLHRLAFIKTGIGTHGIYPSRDGKRFYVSNRGWHILRGRPHGPGSISVLDPTTRSVVAEWKIPDGGSPDMGNVSVDGKELWLSGRYDHEVYVFDTGTGALLHRINVGRDPHGLTVWPQPGRFSLGHTGNMR